MLAVQGKYDRLDTDCARLNYRPQAGHSSARDGARTARSPLEEVEEVDYRVTNSSQPSLTYSLSTHADSIPSSICRPDLADYSRSEYGHDHDQQVSYEDDSDLDSLHIVTAPKPRVTFMTPSLPRDLSSARPLGMKKRAQKQRPATSPRNQDSGVDTDMIKTSPNLSVEFSAAHALRLSPSANGTADALALHDETLLVATRRRAGSNANPTYIEMENLSLSEHSPSIAASSLVSHTASLRAPLSVLDEFDWHGKHTSTAPTQRPHQHPQQLQQRATSMEESNATLASALLRPTGQPYSSSSNGHTTPASIRPKGSMATLMPNRDQAEGEENPFAFSPPSLSHDGFEEMRPRNGSVRNSMHSGASPSMLSLASSAGGSSGLEPREILKRAKNIKATCGLDEEMIQGRGSPDSDPAEIMDDLPPLLSTYYLNDQDVSREQLTRLMRNPERLRAAQAEKERVQGDKAASRSRNSRPVKSDDLESISILAAEAKFLAGESKSSSLPFSSGGGKISSLLKKKSALTSKRSASGHSKAGKLHNRGNGSSACHQDDNERMYHGSLLSRPATMSASASASVVGKASSSRDLRGRYDSYYMSEASFASHGGTGREREEELTPIAPSSKGLSRLFGGKKKVSR